MAADEKWYFTKEQIQCAPSRKYNYDVDKELSCRQQAANFIQDMGQRLQVYPFINRFVRPRNLRFHSRVMLCNFTGFGVFRGFSAVNLSPTWRYSRRLERWKQVKWEFKGGNGSKSGRDGRPPCPHGMVWDERLAFWLDRFSRLRNSIFPLSRQILINLTRFYLACGFATVWWKLYNLTKRGLKVSHPLVIPKVVSDTT